MKALIVEDEILASQNLRKILEDLGSFDAINILDSVNSSIEYFRHNDPPDLLFLDIHLADGLAFEIFDKVQVDCPVIFVTAYDEYALKAFRVNSIDYLLKPLDIFDVKRALDKLKRFSRTSGFMETELKNLLSYFKKTSAYKSNFLIPLKGDKLMPLKADDIGYLYIDHGVVKVFTFDGKAYTMDNTLDELEGMLDPELFFRANRQFIISRKALKDIDFWFNSKLSVNLKVQTPEKIIVSKAKVTEFKNWFSRGK
jgi:two-component system, LytTR family, response regulator